MASSAFCYVNPKHSLAADVKVNTLVNQIIQKVSEIPNHTEYKHNMELLKMVCSILEQEVDNKKNRIKIDKKDIVFRVWTRIFDSMKPADIKDLEANIQYLWENGQIKRKGFIKVAYASVCDWFRRRIF